uniref:Uncharacterized protein n=1 Tax=Caenorhabditis japonica TaxID=281687 RepID=A0A8R1E6L4_CAEJA
MHHEFAATVCKDLLFIRPRPTHTIEPVPTSITNRPRRRPRRFPNAGPESFGNAEADIPLRKTTILANFVKFRIPMVTPLICFDPDTQFCG